MSYGGSQLADGGVVLTEPGDHVAPSRIRQGGEHPGQVISWHYTLSVQPFGLTQFCASPLSKSTIWLNSRRFAAAELDGSGRLRACSPCCPPPPSRWTMSPGCPRASIPSPRLLAESADLIEVMREKSVAEVASLMHISEDLAALNVQRYADFHTPFTTRNARPAALAFHGDVYLGMAPAERFGGARLDRGAEDRPDPVGTVRRAATARPDAALPPGDGYAVGDPPRGQGPLHLVGAIGSVHCWPRTWRRPPRRGGAGQSASDEYFRSVRPRVIGVPIIAPRFEDTSESGVRSVISFFAKRARGEMAAWLVLNRVRRVGELTGFDGAGYRYDPASSTRERPVFVRAYADRPALAAPFGRRLTRPG